MKTVKKICYGMGGFSGGRLFSPLAILFLAKLSSTIKIQFIAAVAVFGLIVELIGIGTINIDKMKMSRQKIMFIGGVLSAIFAELMILPTYTFAMPAFIFCLLVFGLYSVCIGVTFSCYYSQGLKLFNDHIDNIGYELYRLLASVVFVLILLKTGLLESPIVYQILIFILLVSILVPAYFVSKEKKPKFIPKTTDLKPGLFKLFHIKIARSYLGLQTTRYLGFGIATVLLLMFSRTASVCPNVSSFIWVLIISAIVFSFYWWVMAKKFSLQIGIVISAVALAITCLMFVTLKSTSSRFLILLSLLLWAFGTTGLCFNTEALSIETMSIINLTWGDTGEGALSALTSLIAKITFVLGIAIASYILYSQKLDSMLVVMGKVDLSLFINLAIVSIVIAALNVWIALSYPLKGKKKDQLNKWIALRKEGKDNPLLASTLRKALARDPDYERKPLGCLYFFAGLYQMILTKIKFNTKIKRCRVKKPAIILSNHSSNHDYKFIEAAVWPKRINFLSTYYWFTFEHLRPWLQRIGAIPKLQFTTDINAIRKMRWVLKKNKGIIYIAPEGTVYANGHLCYISPAIIKIIRNFGVNVYSTTIKGASISCGKWEKVPAKGLVEIEMKPLFKANEIETLSDDELYNGIINALDYNEFDFQEEKGFKIKGDHKAEGIDDLLFICPKCKKEFTLSATGDEITCSNCGFKTTINDDFHFVYDKGEKYFENYALWYDWQLEKYYKIIKESGWSFTDKVDYYIDIKDTDGYVKGGTGTLTVDEKGWTYKGTLKGKEVVEKDDLKSVFVAIMKMGQHIELPYKDGHSRCFCFTENGKYSIKWHVISRAINKVLREQEE